MPIQRARERLAAIMWTRFLVATLFALLFLSTAGCGTDEKFFPLAGTWPCRLEHSDGSVEFVEKYPWPIGELKRASATKPIITTECKIKIPREILDQKEHPYYMGLLGHGYGGDITASFNGEPLEGSGEFVNRLVVVPLPSREMARSGDELTVRMTKRGILYLFDPGRWGIGSKQALEGYVLGKSVPDFITVSIYTIVAIGALLSAALYYRRSNDAVNNFICLAGLCSSTAMVRFYDSPLRSLSVPFGDHALYLLRGPIGQLAPLMIVEFPRRIIGAKMRWWIWVVYILGFVSASMRVAMLFNKLIGLLPLTNVATILAFPIMLWLAVMSFRKRRSGGRTIAVSLAVFVVILVSRFALVFGVQNAPDATGWGLNFLWFCALMAGIHALMSARSRFAPINNPGGVAIGETLAATVEQSKNLQSAFISYGGPDENFARKLNDALREGGVKTFFFPAHAIPGKKIGRETRDGVNQHDCVVLVCSKESLSRKGVLAEIEEVLDRERREGGAELVIPVLLDGHLLSGWNSPHPDVAVTLRERVAADFRGWDTDPAKFEQGLRKLIKALKK